MHIFVILVLFVILLGFILSQYVKLYKYKILCKDLPKEFDGFKILQISDWHNRKFGKRIVSMINNSGADLILSTGDMVQRNNIGFDTFLELVENIKLDVPIYAVFGNHELGIEYKKHKNGFLKDYKKLLADRNVTLLDNDFSAVKKANSEIFVCGLTVPIDKYVKLKKPECVSVDDITKAIGEKKGFTLLMAHTPESFETYAKWGADICFCGHNHGGIVNIPFIGGLISAAMEILPKYDKGIFKKDNSVMVLSRGTGNNGCSLRFCNNPEIGLITLKKSDA